MGLYDFTFYDLIVRNAISFGSRMCWREVDDARELSFGQYKEQVDILAAGLARIGLEKGDRVGVVGRNSLEFFLIYGAAACLGAIVLPINWRLSPEEICFNLNDCTPKIVFIDDEFQELLVAQRKALPSVRHFFNLAGDRGSCTGFATLLQEKGVEPAEIVADDGFVIIHTAAVAGRPRGALLSHGNMALANLHLHSAMAIGEGDVHLNILPLFHVAGLFMASSVFHAGGLNLDVRRFEATAAAKLVEEWKVTLFFEFPPILDSILSAAGESNCDISSLRAVIGLGTPEVIKTFQEMTGGEYYVMYGQTETSCLATIGRFKDCPGSAGKTIPLGLVRLFDDYDREVAIGEIGEICLKGPMVFQGYWQLPQDNNYTFREGFHHTGDLGRFDADGYLFYAGRKAEKELIKPGGENVYPAEVEKVILLHPAVVQAVVIGVPDPKWKEGIKAVVELNQGMSLTEGELIHFVGERIAHFKRPQYVELVQAMPRKEDGSVDRQQIKELYGAG